MTVMASPPPPSGKATAALAAASLLRSRRAAALATLHGGAPAVSMVPFAIVGPPLEFVLLVSSLATHTRDLRADPRVALLVTAAESEGDPAHALPRVSLAGSARSIDPADPAYDAARAAYEARHPAMTGLFALGDFSLVAIVPDAVRFVGGFAQAASIEPDTLARALFG